MAVAKPGRVEATRVQSLKASRVVADAALTKADRHFVTALSRGLELLACFRNGDRMLGNQELARRCGLPKSTVSRLTHTLTKLGYLVYLEESAKYSLGTATLSLGSGFIARLDVRKLAHPLMLELAQFSSSLVSLGARDRLSMLYIDVVRGPAAVTLSLDMGSRINIATSAMGRAYMAAVPEVERDDILDRVRELTTEAHWPELKAGVDRAVSDMQELGVCCSFGEWQKEVNAIAVPLHPGGGLPPMSINCGAPAYIVSKEFLLNDVRPRLLAIAAEIEASLGTGQPAQRNSEAHRGAVLDDRLGDGG